MSVLDESIVKDFQLSCSDANITKLSDYKGHWLVLYFYPKDNTSGCTKQATEFSAMYAKFKQHKIHVVGVSRDSLKSHDKFIEKLGIPFPLLADESGELSRYFDVLKEKSMYGRKYIGIERSTFIINPQFEVVAEFRKVKVPGHAEEMLATVLDYCA